MYIVRRINYNDPTPPKISGTSAPCQHCTSLMKQCGIKKIKYVDVESNVVCEKLKNYSTQHVSQGKRLCKSKLIDKPLI